MELYGLVGRNISYSFSRDYFSRMFSRLHLNAAYENFDLDDISRLPEVLSRPNLRGFNVTIPFKESIIPFLDSLSAEARAVGAINTVKVLANGRLEGYNTDWIGFRDTLIPLLTPAHRQALILGTGGASKAVKYALDFLKIDSQCVSRKGHLCYENLIRDNFDDELIIVNCTPLGTFPNTEQSPPLPAGFFRKADIAFDLVYNPPVTRFLETAAAAGASTINGLPMLQVQAQKAWEIWQQDPAGGHAR